jgi:hypothetical protein
MVTVRKILGLGARREIAASYSRASAMASAVMMIRSAWGKVKKIDAIMIPTGP